MSDDSTKPAEVTPEASVVAVAKPEAVAIVTLGKRSRNSSKGFFVAELFEGNTKAIVNLR